MRLTDAEVRLFYDLYAALLSFVNRKVEVSSAEFSTAAGYTTTPPEARAAIRDALFEHRELIDEFVAENPAHLKAHDLEIVAAWKHAVVGKFYVFRYLKKHAVFLTSGGSPNRAFGVLGLADPLEEIIGSHLPRLITTVLLPFRDKIVYDGLVSGYNITFGGGVKRMLNEEYKQAKEAFGIITLLPFEGEEAKPTEEDEAVIVTYDRSGRAHEIRIGGNDKASAPLRLTQAQRRAVAGLLPDLAPRLLLENKNQRTLHFALAKMKEIATECTKAISKTTGTERNSLRHVVEAAERGIEKSQGIANIPAKDRVYQFKITLKEVQPPVWRRIQTRDCTLDKLHERIQTAMGWTNSHLHQFTINGTIHGDPELLCEGLEGEEPPVDSLETRISRIVPEDGKPFRFDYEYDFGDGWEHEILFEGCLCAEKGVRYPLCVEGERACPPEDVGGPPGYEEYLEALGNPEHENWDEMSDWQGPCRPEHFDAAATTKDMRRGLPNWRKME